MSELAKPRHSWPLDYGDPLGEYRALREAWGHAAFPGAGAILAGGAGAAAFLEALLSGPVDRPAGEGGRVLALGADGGVRFDLCVSRLDAERFLLTGSGKVGEALIAHLGEQPGADAVTLSLAGERWLRLGLGGPQVAEPLRELTGLAVLPAQVGQACALADDGWLLRSDRSGELLYEWFIPRAQAADAQARLAELGAPAIGCTAFGWTQLENGRFFQRQLAGRHPGAVGLDGLLSPDKDSFLGREAALGAPVSERIAVLRCPAASADGTPVHAGEVRVGELLHSAPTPRLAGAQLSVALVEADHAEPGTRLRVGDHEALVLELPVPAPA